MLEELVLAILLGAITGIFTGLIPGIHINLVSTLLVSSSAFFLSFISPLALIIFIVSMSITHTFLDFIPSIFLGAPDEDTALSVLPGHSLLNQGKGYLALLYTIIGGITSLPLMLFLSLLFLYFLPTIFLYAQKIMIFILLFASLYLILREKDKIFSLFIFILAGFLGLASMNILENSLLPLLTGLFGSSSLITSIVKKSQIPKQEITSIKNLDIKKSDIAKVSVASFLSTPLCSFLPSLGSSQAAIIGSDLIDDKNPKIFLLLLGSINLIVMSLSFITLYLINKARTGSAAAIQEIRNLSSPDLIYILIAIIISSILSSLLAVYIGKLFSKNITQVSYSKLSMFILIFVSIIVLILSGILGFLVFIISTFLGLYTILRGIRRTNLMGALMLPSILFYLGI